MSIMDNAKLFFDACDTGKGWAGCKDYCKADASFSCQANALADVTTVEAYCEWMKGLMVPLPDAKYDVKAMSHDTANNVVTIFAVIRGTNTADGPVPATNKSAEVDYVYALHFDNYKVAHMTKIWNDGHTLEQLGWA